MEYDAEWAKQIRLRKFQIYNSQWLEAIERDGGVEGVSQVTLSEMFLVGFMMFLTAKAGRGLAVRAGQCVNTWAGVAVFLRFFLRGQ